MGQMMRGRIIGVSDAARKRPPTPAQSVVGEPADRAIRLRDAIGNATRGKARGMVCRMRSESIAPVNFSRRPPRAAANDASHRACADIVVVSHTRRSLPAHTAQHSLGHAYVRALYHHIFVEQAMMLARLLRLKTRQSANIVQVAFRAYRVPGGIDAMWVYETAAIVQHGYVGRGRMAEHASDNAGDSVIRACQTRNYVRVHDIVVVLRPNGVAVGRIAERRKRDMINRLACRFQLPQGFRGLERAA